MRTLTLATLFAALSTSASLAETLDYDVVFNDSLLTARSDALSVGDRIIVNDRLLQNGREAGNAAGVCTIVDVEASTAICTIAFTLEDGLLAVQFVNSPPPEKHFPILGGTGAYAGRLGTGTLIEHGDGTGTVRFVID